MTKGSITASCGHLLADGEESVPVRYASETCDAVDGFAPCVVYGEYCPACATDLEDRGLMLSEAEAEAHISLN